MTQQMVGTELAFTQAFGSAERQILTDDAVEFLAELVGKFTPKRNKLLAARASWQEKIDRGELPVLFRKRIPFDRVTGRSAAFPLTCATVG